MSEARRQDFESEAFLAWEADRPRRWEGIDVGTPLMTGRTRAHRLTAGNIVAARRPRLRGSLGEGGGSDLHVVTGMGIVPDPDAMRDPGALRRDLPDVAGSAVVLAVAAA